MPVRRPFNGGGPFIVQVFNGQITRENRVCVMLGTIRQTGSDVIVIAGGRDATAIRRRSTMLSAEMTHGH